MRHHAVLDHAANLQIPDDDRGHHENNQKGNHGDQVGGHPGIVAVIRAWAVRVAKLYPAIGRPRTLKAMDRINRTRPQHRTSAPCCDLVGSYADGGP